MAQELSPESPFKEEVQKYLEESGVKETTDEILGPFSEITNQILEAMWNALLPGSPFSSLSWELLTFTFICAAVFWFSRKGRGSKDSTGRERPAKNLLQYLFPKDIYTHQSARVDIGLYLLDRGMFPIWFALSLGAVAPFLERNTIAGFEAMFGASPAIEPTVAWRLFYGLVSILMVDAIFYWTHYMMHKTQIGWALHKVHHSAQVLTPWTRPREHFIVGPLWALGPAIGLAISGGIFAWVFNGNITQITIVNVGIFSVLYALNGNFRHYHVSFRYPRSLELWLQSPGMHHTHHSYLEKHWDSNLGLVTSIWDRMMGTIYIADKYEETPWGLAEKDQREYTILKDNLVTPVKEICRILRGRPKEYPAQSSPDLTPRNSTDLTA
ncbi:MAG: sterol desaturase family protein [Woeseiaceae bacterium]|nr:sterol desaturase family protein [Woeseiaceae bacterium]